MGASTYVQGYAVTQATTTNRNRSRKTIEDGLREQAAAMKDGAVISQRARDLAARAAEKAAAEKPKESRPAKAHRPSKT
jgi:hypothetical protein